MNDPMGSLERFYEQCDAVQPPSVGVPVRRGALLPVARAVAQLAGGFVAAAVALSVASAWQVSGEAGPYRPMLLPAQLREAGLTMEDLEPLVVRPRRSSEVRSWRA